MLSIAGAYFGDDASNKMLTRVYGHAFADKAQMEEHRKNLEEAAKRDHRRLGTDLDLFSTMGEYGAGYGQHAGQDGDALDQGSAQKHPQRPARRPRDPRIPLEE